MTTNEKEQVNHLGLLNDFIKKPESEEFKTHDKCLMLSHGKQLVKIITGENITRYYCKECMLSFDVDSSG